MATQTFPTGQTDGETPALPPPPLSAPNVIPQDLLLPSFTPLATFGMGTAAGALVLVVGSGFSQFRWNPEAAVIGLMVATLGYLVGLSVLATDRARPHWARPWRWAAGMAVGGAFPVINAVKIIASPPPPLAIALTVAVAVTASSVSFASLGLLFGLQATLFRGLVFRFTFVGFWAASLCSVLMGLSVQALSRMDVGVAYIFTVFWALGPLVGLVLALGLNHARREREGQG